MLKWALGIIGGLVWCFIVFVATLWFTFPSASIVDRLAFEVQKASNGTVALKADSASPWWSGISLSNAKLLSVDPDNKAGASTMIEAEAVSARVGLLSLLDDAVSFNGYVDLGASGIDYEGQFNRAKQQLTSVRATAPTLNVADLLGLATPYIGDGVTGDGTVDLNFKLKLGQDVKDYKGKLALKGGGIQTTVAIPDPLNSEATFDLGKGKISTLDLVIDLDDGVAKVSRGTLRSTYLNLTLTGDVNLNQRIGRSRMRMDAVVGNLHETFKPFEPLMSAAKWDDDQYHYRISCTFERLGASCLRPERKRGSRPSRLPRASSSDSGSAGGDDNVSQSQRDADQRREERRKAREQRLEERRKNLEDSNARRPGDPNDEDHDDDLMDDREEIDDLDRRDIELRDPGLMDPRDLVAPPGPAIGLPMDMPPGGTIGGPPDPANSAGGFE